MRVLLVEDDAKISGLLKELLEEKGWAVDLAFGKKDAWEKVFVEDHDLLILDWMLPDGDGVKLCKEVRQEGFSQPILMLTAKSMVEDIEEGLDSGADDYITKPFEIRELMARIRALTRRKDEIVDAIFEKGKLSVDLNLSVVKLAGMEILLSPKEFAVLECLIRNQGRVLTREQICASVWNELSELSANNVDVYIRFLRKKLEDNEEVGLIKTVRGKGYSL